MITIYWKKVEVWCEHPFNQEIDYRYIKFSPSRKKFEKKAFDFTCDPQLVGHDRTKFVAEQLNKSVKKIYLMRV